MKIFDIKKASPETNARSNGSASGEKNMNYF